MKTVVIYDSLIGPMIVAAIFVLIYTVFLFWYGGRGKPLSQAELEAMLDEIKTRAGKQAQLQEAPIFAQFRALTSSDDGREYYMVNLLKFREKALYPAGSHYGDDSAAANDRYNRAIIPLLLKHGGHPVFAGQVLGRFIHSGANDDWDQVAMVRYRSRRDMLEMAVEIAGKGVDLHKWAALEKTHVFPVRPLVNLIFVRATVAVILFVIATLFCLLLGGLHLIIGL